ncbi:proteasome assembly chaperone 2 [Monosporozyma unispora]
MTLVLPLVSTGNVPQLTVDLILHSFNDDFHFIEDLDSKYLHPFVGPLDHTLTSTISEPQSQLYSNASTKKYSSALELFTNQDQSIYIIQQRTPIIQGYLNNFIQEVIIPLITNYKISTVSILDSYGAFDNNIITSLNKTDNNNISNISIGNCDVNSINNIVENFDQSLNLKYDSNSTLHYTTQFFQFNKTSPIQEISTNQSIFKITYHLLNNINIANTSSLNEINYFNVLVHEGDNSLDAKYIIKRCLPQILNEKYSILEDSQFKIPISWKGVYGMGEVPSSIEEGIYI